MTRAPLLAIVLLIGCSAEPARPWRWTPDSDYGFVAPRTVRSALDRLPARRAIQLVAAFAGRQVVIAADVPDLPITRVAEHDDWRALLADVVASLGPFPIVDDGGYLRVETATPGRLTIGEGDAPPSFVVGRLSHVDGDQVDVWPLNATSWVTLRLPPPETPRGLALREAIDPSWTEPFAPWLAVVADPDGTITHAVVGAARP